MDRKVLEPSLKELYVDSQTNSADVILREDKLFDLFDKQYFVTIKRLDLLLEDSPLEVNMNLM
jgi:hypothetical protein